jgi:hypothetical protein
MNPLQRAVVRRKVIYLAAILGLFTVSMFWRGTIPIPLSGSARAGEPSAAHRFADRVASRTILNRSISLELRELEEGEAELEGEGLNLVLKLVGVRGPVVAYLWNRTVETQKRNDFHKMDGLIRTVTRLQPHFITPWIFQSWNIAYNVSVEMQGSGDMYYYIARGIELLAEGERRQGRKDPETGQRLGSPDMRYQIAFYYQNKFGVSDNVEVLRCLFQLSCIPPNDRNAHELAELDPGGKVVRVNQAKFREFCEKYPHLVRRLRGEDRRATGSDEMSSKRIAEGLKCPLPADVVQFLHDNREVPRRFKSANELAEADKQFPVLPPKFPEGPEEAHPGMETKDDFSAFKAARAWFAYGCVPLPPNPLDRNDKPLPARAPGPGEYDPIKYRVPRQPMLIIFRQGPPRAQSYQGEMEQKEGWFDSEGWRIDDPREHPSFWWFPDPAAPRTRPLDLVVGRTRSWSAEEWAVAARMWQEHGDKYGLEVDRARLASYENASRYRPPGVPANPTQAQLEDPEVRRWYETAMAPTYYVQNRQVTNFAYFQATARAEARPATVLARKILWQAEQARKLGNKTGENGAIALYEKGLQLWKDVLLGDKDFHRPDGGRSTRTEEDTYGYELSYIRLIVQDDQRVRDKAGDIARQMDAAATVLPFPFCVNWRTNQTTLALEGAFGVLPFPFTGAWTLNRSPLSVYDAQTEIRWYVAENDPEFSPFVGVMRTNDDRNGGPWIPDYIKEAVKVQQGVLRKKPDQLPPGTPADPQAAGPQQPGGLPPKQ